MKTQLILGFKILVLVALFFVCSVLSAAATNALFPVDDTAYLGAPTAGLVWVVIYSLYAIVLTYPIVRSRWTGWRLMLVIFVVYYGITTILTMIEAVVFIPQRLSEGMVAWEFVHHAILGALIAPLAVLVFGKVRPERMPEEENLRLVMPAHRWAWKLGVIAGAYVFLYLLFGALIAWQVPAVREYYADATLPSPAAMISLQAFRALIWTAVAIPVIRMMQGRPWETALAVGLLFAVLMNAGLLAPNPVMPLAVRMTHLVETASSNFIFGWFLVWLLLSRSDRMRKSAPPGRRRAVRR